MTSKGGPPMLDRDPLYVEPDPVPPPESAHWTTAADFLIRVLMVVALAALTVLAIARLTAPPTPAPDPAPVAAQEPNRVAPAELTATVQGLATWYCASSSTCTRGYGPSDLVAAIDRSTGFGKGDRLIVRSGGRSVTVTVVDTCACAGRRVIDLTSGAFARLAGLAAGVIPVSLQLAGSSPGPTAPPTDIGG